MQQLKDLWQSTIGKLAIIGGAGVLFCFVCAVCGVLVGGSGDGDKPTAKEEAARKMVSFETEEPQTAEEAAPPAPSLRFSEVIQHPDDKGWNTTQYNNYFKTIKGQAINGWSGIVLEVKEYAGEPYDGGEQADKALRTCKKITWTFAQPSCLGERG
jgi:hypothetical protein